MRAAMIVSLAFLPKAAAAASASVTFPFDDARYLQPGEKEGGLVHRTDEGASGALPLVVYLHGTNEKGPLHRGLGAPGFDLRKTIETLDLPPLLIAGPSTTKDAWTGSKLWPDFDLTRFVDAVDGALPSGVKADRARVILAGHSGAGCNQTGGLLSRAGLSPFAILAIDTCLDADFGRAFGEAASRAPVHVFWQESWPRDVAGFEAAFTEALQKDSARRGTIERVDVQGPNPHEDIVPLTIARMLPELLGD
jgi:hypothetical protein